MTVNAMTWLVEVVIVVFVDFAESKVDMPMRRRADLRERGFNKIMR